MTTERLMLERPSAFRRRRFVVPHRRRSRTLVLLKPFALALLLVGAPVAAALWVATSPRFVLSGIQIGPTQQVAPAEVTAALSGLEGRHLLSLHLEEVEELLMVNPWIAGAAIRKELPNRLVVEIRERVPVALLRRADGIYYVDATGFLIAPYSPLGPVDLPLLGLARGAELEVAKVLELMRRCEQVAPGWSGGISEIEILGDGDFRIFSAALAFPIVVTAAGLESELAKLGKVLPEIERRYEVVRAVDLRFSRQIVIQPAGEPRSQEG